MAPACRMAAVPAREASESAISRAPQRALNAIGPAAQTDATKAHFERHPQLRAQTLSMFPLRRLGDIRDDIGAIVAPCSDDMQFVTGPIIPVDRGAYTALWQVSGGCGDGERMASARRLRSTGLETTYTSQR